MNNVPVFGERAQGVSYKYRPSAYAVVRNAMAEFAVARTPVACYLLGGGMDPGETPEQTVDREAQEECGLVLKPLSRIGQAMEICYSVEDKVHYEKDSIFIEANVIGTITPTEVDHQLLWLAVDEAIALLSHGSHKWALEKVMDRQ